MTFGNGKRGNRQWTAKEVEQLERHVLDGTPWPTVGKLLKRTAWACQCKAYQLGAIGRTHRENRTKRVAGNAEERIAPQLRDERDMIEAARDRRTPTQVFFNDPPPGFSALDGMRGLRRAPMPRRSQR